MNFKPELTTYTIKIMPVGEKKVNFKLLLTETCRKALHEAKIEKSKSDQNVDSDYISVLEQINEDNNDKLTNSLILNIFKRVFEDELNKNKAKVDKTKNKVLTRDRRLNYGIKIDSTNEAIYGVISGGGFNEDRHFAKINDVNESINIDREYSELKSYFFLLKMPLNENIGCLFIQSYTTSNIDISFSKYLRSKMRVPMLTTSPQIRFFNDPEKETKKRNVLVKKIKFHSRQIKANDIHIDSKIIDDEMIYEIIAIPRKSIKQSNVSALIGQVTSFFSGKSLDHEKTYFETNEESFKINNRSRALNLIPKRDISHILSYDQTKKTIDGYDELKNFCLDLYKREVEKVLFPEIKK